MGWARYPAGMNFACNGATGCCPSGAGGVEALRFPDWGVWAAAGMPGWGAGASGSASVALEEELATGTTGESDAATSAGGAALCGVEPEAVIAWACEVVQIPQIRTEAARDARVERSAYGLMKRVFASWAKLTGGAGCATRAGAFQRRTRKVAGPVVPRAWKTGGNGTPFAE